MRRSSRRGVSMLGALALFVVLTAGPVGASINWCKADPTVEIGRNRVHINVYSTEEALTAVTAPTEVRILVPPGVRTELIAEDNGFGLGWDVTFERDGALDVREKGIETRILVRVPVGAGVVLPVKAEIVDRGNDVVERNVGTTERYVILKAWL